MNQSEERNAGSIIIRLYYREKTVLFTGNAVGRHDGVPQNAVPIAMEKFIIEIPL